MATAFAGQHSAARPRFWLYMAAAVTLIAFGGFIPSYWSKLASGSFAGQPVMHLHGALFFAWTLLFFSQTALVAAGRTPSHRNWGMVGIFLVGMMAVSVPLASINEIWAAERISPEAGDMARRFVAVPMTGLLVMVGLFAAAIANVKQPEAHKRLMLLMQMPLLQAAAGRVTAVLAAPGGVVPPGPPPGAFVSIPGGLVVNLLIVVAMVHDWRTTGRVHPAYLVGWPIVLFVMFATVPISQSDWWMGVASWLQHLAR